MLCGEKETWWNLSIEMAEMHKWSATCDFGRELSVQKLRVAPELGESCQDFGWQEPSVSISRIETPLWVFVDKSLTLMLYIGSREWNGRSLSCSRGWRRWVMCPMFKRLRARDAWLTPVLDLEHLSKPSLSIGAHARSEASHGLEAEGLMYVQWTAFHRLGLHIEIDEKLCMIG